MYVPQNPKGLGTIFGLEVVGRLEVRDDSNTAFGRPLLASDLKKLQPVPAIARIRPPVRRPNLGENPGTFS